MCKKFPGTDTQEYARPKGLKAMNTPLIYRRALKYRSLHILSDILYAYFYCLLF